MFFRYTPYWGRSKTPYFHRLTVFDVWFWRQKSSNEKWKKCQDSRNSLRPTFYNVFSQISGHFCHHVYPFSLISQSIRNRFLCNFAGTICNYYGDCPEKLAKFERVLQKLLMRLMWNMIGYFKSYLFRRQFRRKFSTVYHVILQEPSAGITATSL